MHIFCYNQSRFRVVSKSKTTHNISFHAFIFKQEKFTFHDLTLWPKIWHKRYWLYQMTLHLDIKHRKKGSIEMVFVSMNSITLVMNLNWTKRVFIEPLVADLIFGRTFNGSNFAYKYSIFKELEQVSQRVKWP